MGEDRRGDAETRGFLFLLVFERKSLCGLGDLCGKEIKALLQEGFPCAEPSAANPESSKIDSTNARISSFVDEPLTVKWFAPYR
jgi:hypothetical protein